MIDAKYRTPKYFLKPTYPQNAGDIGYMECYQSWLVYGTLFVNKYVELLHRQLVRKGRARKMSVNHPLYKNSYAINYYDIKSSSVRPYNYDSYSDLGLNQFFVGQSPYEWYKGDPGDDNGIYHDTSQIIRKSHRSAWNSSAAFTLLKYFTGDTYIVANKNEALNYQDDIEAYFLDDKTIFDLIGGNTYKDKPLRGNTEGIPSNNSYYEYPTFILRKISSDMDKPYVLPPINDDTIIPVYIGIFNKTLSHYNYQPFVDAFMELNPDVKVVNSAYREVIIRNGADNTTITTINDYYFEEIFKNAMNDYPYTDIFHPFAVNSSSIIFKEPVIYNGKELIPLYLNSTNSPIGRKDRWFILWDTYYDLYVKEDKEWYDFFIGAIMVVVVVAVAIWTGYATAGALSNIIGGAMGTILSNLAIVLGYVSGVSSGLSMLGAGGKFMSVLAQVSSIALTVLNITTMGFQIKQNIQTAIANQTPIMDELFVGFGEKITTETGEEITKFGLNHMFLKTLNLAKDVMSIVNHKAPLDINESVSEDDIFFGSQEQEQEKLIKSDVLGQDWYNFETFDILNETRIKKDDVLFVF